eukprot:jgi/Ulvmu1/10577/UM065_0031.1
MCDDGFAELTVLKKRLESLGVKIKGDPSGEKGWPQDCEGVQKQDVHRLLARCTRVEAALNTCADAPAQNSTFAVQIPVPDCRHASAEPLESPKKHSKRSTKRGFIPTVRAPYTGQAINRASPLSGLLADYREAETKWNHERAELRRLLTNEKKRSVKLEGNLNRVHSMYDSKMTDLKAVRSALASREEQIKAAVQHAKELETAHAKAINSDRKALMAMTRERDDLKALLMASLQRLEAVDRVVQRADQSNAAMEQQVTTLEHEKNKASEAAAAAQAQVEALVKSQRRVEWQNKMLDRISAVQLAHNRSKTAAMHELLETGAESRTDQASTAADTCTENL